MTSHRKLAAILSADAAGYSRLMADDERATVDTLNTYRHLIRERVTRHEGRVVDAPGDALLAEFPSAVEAVDCATEIQHELAKRNAQLAEHRRMVFRIGINLGDVIEQEDGTISGDGVNVAARLQALAEIGGICISGTAYDQAEGKLPLAFKFIGEQQVKNIPKPVRAYRLPMDTPAGMSRHAQRGKRRVLAIGAAAIVAIVVAAGIVWKVQKPATENPSSTADPALAMPTGPAIAVLPFTNMSGDPKEDYFSDGLTEDIITGLSRFHDFYVIARNSTFRYKGRAVDVREVGRDLGVKFVLEGSVRRSADRIRVTAQLLDATNGTHLWAESYDRNLTTGTIFDIQDDITSKVVIKIGDPLGGTIARTGLDQMRKGEIVGLHAYDCVLKARDYFASFDPAAHVVARSCLEDAVKNNSHYADAWAWLALVYCDEYAFGYSPRPDSVERAIAAGRRSIELDPANQMGHWFLARALFFSHQLENFRSEAERAIALNVNNATVVGAAGLYLSYAGDWERGNRLVHRAIALNPVPPGWYYFPLFYYEYNKREYERALAYAQKIDVPALFWTHVVTAAVYGQLGLKGEAHAAVQKLLSTNPNFPSKAREEFFKYNIPESLTEHMLSGLRKAGLSFPEDGG